MRTRAAVALEAGKPLEVMDVNLEGPTTGEVLVEIKASGVSHSDEFTISAADSEGLFPVILGHEGAGVVLEVGQGVTTLKPGDHVIPLYTPECRRCSCSLSRKANIQRAIRVTQEQKVMPDRTTRFTMRNGTPILHCMGCSTFANHTVLPEMALAKVRQDAPFEKICQIGCVTTGVGAVINTAKVEIGSKAVVFGLGGIGLNVIQGLKLAGAEMIIGVDPDDDRQRWGERFGMTHFVNPLNIEGSLVQHIVKMTKTQFDQIGGADYSFGCTGDAKVMRDALECTHRGWGVCVVTGVAPAGAETQARSFQLVAGRMWKGSTFGSTRGRTDVPRIVELYMEGRIQLDPMITHYLTLDEINAGFDLMRAGKSIRPVVLY